MNNLRSVKKDVIYLVNEVISDCWVYKYMNGDKNKEEVDAIITDAIKLGDKLFLDINNYPKGKGEAAKFFKVLEKELMDSVEALFGRIGNLK